MFQITILLLYLLAAVAFAMCRLPKYSTRSRPLLIVAVILAVLGLAVHGQHLFTQLSAANGLSVSLPGAVSLIAFQLALIGLIGAIEPTLRGMSAGLFLLAAIASLSTGLQADAVAATSMTWQIQAHVLISMFAYGLLTAGAIVAIYALVQDKRLRSGRISEANRLFAPLETTEKMLFSVTAAGFAGLLLAIVSGFAFVENLFAQHLSHKTTFSLLALLLFGVLLGGRMFAGWRGRRAVYLYLWGFAFLFLAYFGSRIVLEVFLDRSWG